MSAAGAERPDAVGAVQPAGKTGLADVTRAPEAPFVTTLRSRPGVIRLGAPDVEAITLRVEMPEVWDVVRVEVPPDERVVSVKESALAALFPKARFPEDFVMKLHGFEVTNENLSVTEAGARDGSIFLLMYRRRRPVK